MVLPKPSVNAGNNHPFDPLAIFLPALPILHRTALLISPAAVNQQRSHENRVRPGEQIGKTTSRTHRVREDKIAKVVHVSCVAPPAGAEEKTVMLEPVFRAVFDTHDLGWGTPEEAVALGASYKILLVIDGAEENVSTYASEEKEEELEIRQDDWVNGEILCLECVYTGKPDNRAPCEVKSEVIMTDIDGA